MNLHPISVHFPVALFTLYALLECARFRKIKEQAFYFYLKAFLVITGSIASGVAYITGDLLKNQLPNDPQLRSLVELHSNWAMITIGIFGLIALAYFLTWLTRHNAFGPNTDQILRRIIDTAERFTNSWLVILFAVAGLISVTITGALGGSIVYGPRVDPVVIFIYWLFSLPSS